MDANQLQAGAQPRALTFTGTGSEYFKIWIVNLALTIVTFGIYSAWAKVRRLRYFYGHTQLAGEGFSYLADPVKIFKGRLIATALFIAYTVCWNFFPGAAFWVMCVGILVIPFIIVTSSAFRLRNSAYCNIRFHFRADYANAYRAVLPPVAIALGIAGLLYFTVDPTTMFPVDDEAGVTFTRQDFLPNWMMLGLLPVIPWLDAIRSRFVIGHTQFGDIHGEFHAGTWDFYKLYIAFVFIQGAVAFVLGAVITGISALVMGSPGEDRSAEALAGPMVLLIPLFILFYAAIFATTAWFAARRNNILRDNTQFGINKLYGEFKARGVLWLYFSNAVLTVLTLGLFIPWAMVRIARYNAEHTLVDTLDLDSAVAVAASKRSAIGEEIGDMFDIDLGL